MKYKEGDSPNAIMALFKMRKLLNQFRKLFGHLDSPEFSLQTEQPVTTHSLLSSFPFEHAPDAICWVKSDATISYANQAACTSLGFTREELMGLKVMDVDVDMTLDRWSAHWQAVRTHQKVTLESHHRHKSGKVFPVDITAHFMSFGGEEYNYVIARDISERRKREGEQKELRERIEVLMSERNKSLEKELITAEERLRLAIEASKAGVWDWNIQTGETYYSPAYFEMLGYDPSSFGSNVEALFLDLLHPDERDTILPSVKESLEGPGLFSVDFQMRSKDGTYRWIRSRGKLVDHDAEGRPLRAIGTHIDITERKLTELALIESESRFRDMADSAPVMIWMSGLDKLCYFFNKGWLDFTGRTLDQESGNGWAEGVHPEDFDRCLKIYVESFDARRHFKMDYRLRRHDGVYRWIEDNGSPRFDGQGEFLGYIGSCIDINERKEAEEYFKIIVEASPSAMLLLNDQGTIELVNNAFIRLFGYSAEEITGQLIEEVVPNDLADDHVRHRDLYLQKPVSCEIGKERIVLGKRKDGTTFQVEIGLSPIQVGSRQFVISVIVDVTQRKMAERAILDMNANLEKKVRERTEALEKASAAKSEFLANMSHEIRNPMNTINLSSYMLGRESLTKQQMQMVERISRSSKSLLMIVNEILDFSKMEAGQVDLELTTFNLGDLLHRMAESFVVMASEKDIRLHAQLLLSELPNVVGDSVRIEQVLNNLLGNAIKFTREGDVWLRVTWTRKEQHAVSLAFEVSDTGEGIPAEVIPLLGQPFTQADNSVTRRFGGTGLGLSICKKLLELMSSTLTIHSTVGLGSAFSFELILDLAGSKVSDMTEPGSAHSLTGLHIMVVDDDEANLDGMRHLLKAEGADVTVASNGPSAISMLDQNPEKFSLVLMDIQMPLMDGIETTKYIRNQFTKDRLPIIAVTAGILPEQHTKAMSAGINQVLRKPVDPVALIKAILKVLTKPD